MVCDDMDWRTVLLVVLGFEETNDSSETYDARPNDDDGSRRVKRRRHIRCLLVRLPLFCVLDGQFWRFIGPFIYIRTQQQNESGKSLDWRLSSR